MRVLAECFAQLGWATWVVLTARIDYVRAVAKGNRRDGRNLVGYAKIDLMVPGLAQCGAPLEDLA
jgi:hypothetical protein